jgi:hypothetical protein
MPNRQNRKGRSKYDAKHVRLYDYMLSCPAYLSLSCAARAVLIEVARIYDGTNNGRLGLSVRRAAQRCRIAKDTARRALGELQDLGFIDCVTRGSFSRKVRHAAEYRITWKRCDATGELPSYRFKQWGRGNQNTVPICSVTVPSFGTAS